MNNLKSLRRVENVVNDCFKLVCKVCVGRLFLFQIEDALVGV
jgi:hypothetical protein